MQVKGQERPSSASDTTIGRDVLGAAPHKTASDLMGTVPGVFVTQHSGQGKAHQIFFRGFDAQHGQDIEISAGGIPVNEVSNVHGQGYADVHFLMPELVLNLHAKPGSYAASQGDFAVAGSLDFELGYTEPGVTAAVTVGMFGEKRLFLAYHPKNAPDETFAAFEGQTTDGFGPARASRRVGGVGQVLFPITEKLDARILATGYASRFDSAGVLTLKDVLSTDSDPFATYDANQGGDSVRFSGLTELRSHDEEARDTFALAPFVVVRHLRLRHDFTGFLVDPQNGDTTEQVNDAKTFGLKTHYQRKFELFSKRDHIEVGAYTRADWIDQTELRIAQVDSHTTKTLVDAEIQATNIAGYVEAEATAWKRVRLNLGVRVDGLFFSALDRTLQDAGAERSAMGFHIGKKASLDVLPVTGLHLFASYGDGFRSPQARSLSNGETAPFAEVLSFEGGARYSRGPELDLSAAVFHTRLSSDLVFDEAVARNEPVPATARTGFLAAVTARPVPWFTSSTSATFSHAEFTEGDAENEEGDLVPYAPQVVIRSDMRASIPVATFLDRKLVVNLGTGLSFLGARPLPFGDFGRDVFLLDATAGVRFQEGEIRLDVFNMLDSRYFDGEFVYASNFEQGGPATRVPQRHVTVGSPATLFVTFAAYI